MKFLGVFAVLLILQAFACEKIKDDHQPDPHHKEGQLGVPGKQHQNHIPSIGGEQKHHDQIHHNDKQQDHIPGIVMDPKVAETVVQQVEHQVQGSNDSLKPENPVSSKDESKISIVIPPKVQHVVTQVSQHIPQVVANHQLTQSKDRVIRSLLNRQVWPPMSLGSVAEKARKCQFACTHLDLRVCGYNGRCYREFESQCDLSTYNCLNPHKIFHIADDISCMDLDTVKCYPGDI